MGEVIRLECNVGTGERALRLGLGVATATLGGLFLHRRWARAMAMGMGAIEVATGISGYCPINKAVGRNSCHQATG